MFMELTIILSENDSDVHGQNNMSEGSVVRSATGLQPYRYAPPRPVEATRAHIELMEICAH